MGVARVLGADSFTNHSRSFSFRLTLPGNKRGYNPLAANSYLEVNCVQSQQKREINFSSVEP